MLGTDGHQVQIIGHLGKDPELKFTPSGVSLCKFSVASNRTKKVEGGQPEKITTWWNITVWRAQAEACNQYLKKGSQVLVEGILGQNEFGSPKVWTTGEGQPRASFEVDARSVKFLSGGPVSSPEEEDVGISEDEVPF
jgi:single-strand DNA-binding protein